MKKMNRIRRQPPRQRRDINSAGYHPARGNVSHNLYPERVKSLLYQLITPIQGLIASMRIPFHRAMPCANDDAPSALFSRHQIKKYKSNFAENYQ